MSAVSAQAFSHPLLRQQGEAILAALFGGAQDFVAVERARAPLVRHEVSSPIRLSCADIWQLLGERTLDIGNNEFRLVRTDAAGFDNIAPARYACAGRERAGKPVAAPDPAKVREFYDAGATLAVQRLDRYSARMAGHCAALSAWLGHPCQVSAYLSPPHAQGLEIHHDTHDIIVLQLDGEKRFDLFETIVERPVPRIYLQPDQVRAARPTTSHTLRAGDLLYLPRGVPHRAVSCASASLHVTIGILALTWAALIDSLAEELYFIEPLRRSCVAGEVFDPAALGSAAAAAAAALAQWIGMFGAERLAALACQNYVGSFAGRPPVVAGASACALEAAPAGGAYLLSPDAVDYLSAQEAGEWLAAQATPHFNHLATEEQHE
jgi:hypothetical protein